MFIRYFVKLEGLRARWRVETVPKAHYNFARVGRQSENLELDKVFLRQSHEMSASQLLNILTIDCMRGAVGRLDRASRNIVWNGNVDNSTNSLYQECDGILKQIKDTAQIIDATDKDALEKKIKKCRDDKSALWCIAGRAIPGKTKHILNISGCPIPSHNIWETQDLYILPLGQHQTRDNGIYEQRVDYRSGETRPDGAYFWTDDGEFLWQPMQDRWNFDISCRTEFRIVVPRPDLVTVIKNVPVYQPREQGCQQ